MNIDKANFGVMVKVGNIMKIVDDVLNKIISEETKNNNGVLYCIDCLNIYDCFVDDAVKENARNIYSLISNYEYEEYDLCDEYINRYDDSSFNKTLFSENMSIQVDLFNLTLQVLYENAAYIANEEWYNLVDRDILSITVFDNIDDMENNIATYLFVAIKKFEEI